MFLLLLFFYQTTSVPRNRTSSGEILFLKQSLKLTVKIIFHKCILFRRNSSIFQLQMVTGVKFRLALSLNLKPEFSTLPFSPVRMKEITCTSEFHGRLESAFTKSGEPIKVL